MTTPTLPVNYDLIRKTLVAEVQRVTGATCIVAQPESNNADRPDKPYSTLQFLNPGVKKGDDSSKQIPGTSLWVTGGQRKMVVDFNFYGLSHEEAYSYGALWQAALEQETTQAVLRAAGVAVWLNAGPLRDLSALLNTAFEGRCQLEVAFGVASNVTEDRSSIDKVDLDGTVTTDQGTEKDVKITVNAP